MTSNERGLPSMWGTRYYATIWNLGRYTPNPWLEDCLCSKCVQHFQTCSHNSTQKRRMRTSLGRITHGDDTPLWFLNKISFMRETWVSDKASPLLTIAKHLPYFLPAFCGKVWQYRENIWEQCKPLSAVLIYS